MDGCRRSEARREMHQPLKADEEEERDDPRARRECRPPVAGEDGDQRSEHAARRLLREEQIAELRRVETEDEPPERSVPLTLAPRVRAEAPGREVARLERTRHRLARLEAR